MQKGNASEVINIFTNNIQNELLPLNKGSPNYLTYFKVKQVST